MPVSMVSANLDTVMTYGPSALAGVNSLNQNTEEMKEVAQEAQAESAQPSATSKIPQSPIPNLTNAEAIRKIVI